MVVVQRSGKMNAAETSDGTYFLARSSMLQEQNIALDQARIIDKVQNLRPSGSRHSQVVFGQGWSRAQPRGEQVVVCILRQRLLLLIQTNWARKRLFCALSYLMLPSCWQNIHGMNWMEYWHHPTVSQVSTAPTTVEFGASC